MMTTNLFVIANVKQLRTDGSFRILLPFFRTSWGDFGRPSEFRGGGRLNPPPLGTPLHTSVVKLSVFNLAPTRVFLYPWCLKM